MTTATAEHEPPAGAGGVAASPKRKRVYVRKSGLVLAAAERCFLQYGFASTSMDDVADAAGVSKRTVYSNFGSKEELFAKVVEARCSIVPPDAATFEKAQRMELEAGLALIATVFLKGIFAQSQIELYQTVVAAARKRPEIGRIMFDGPIMASQRMFAEFLRGRIGEGEIALDDADRAAAQLIALLKTNAHMALLLNQRIDVSAAAIRRSAADSVGLFLHGVLPRRPKS